MSVVSVMSLDFICSKALLKFCCDHVTSFFVKLLPFHQTPFSLRHIKLAAAFCSVRVPECRPAVVRRWTRLHRCPDGCWVPCSERLPAQPIALPGEVGLQQRLGLLLASASPPMENIVYNTYSCKV